MRKLTLYRKLDRLFPESYRMKFFLVAFVGTHVPLVALALYAFAWNGGLSAHLLEIAIVVFATVIGSALTLSGIWLVLTPVEIAVEALKRYADDRKIMPLETGFRDEAGRLLASVYALLVEVEQSLTDGERLAFSDSLTGLINRRCFDTLLDEKFNSDLGKCKVVHVAIADIDEFKKINDEFGHPAGDEVLRAFADVLRRAVKNEHVVARIGGEEFAILFRDARPEAVDAVCQHVRHLIAGRRVLPRPVTASIGVAARWGVEPMIQTIARADKALYEAKRTGRNRAIFAPSPRTLQAAE